MRRGAQGFCDSAIFPDAPIVPEISRLFIEAAADEVSMWE
jgi:hypothetical protein